MAKVRRGIGLNVVLNDGYVLNYPLEYRVEVSEGILVVFDEMDCPFAFFRSWQFVEKDHG